jgi:hypothetical protein
MNMSASPALINTHGMKGALVKPLLWSAFILFLMMGGYAVAHHESWGDEVHSWNIVKGSASYLDVIHNSRYEGHPPTWYTIMWIVSKFTHNFSWVQVVHFVIAATTIFLLLFRSPLPLFSRLLIPFGYFFLFEFAVIARNYAIGVLLACCICLVIRSAFRYRVACYYLLLLLLSNGHLFALILAGSIHCYFLLLQYEQKKEIRNFVLHGVLGLLFLLPALYFIFPPSQSNLNTGFWMSRWNTSNFIITVQSPIRSFVPIPSWWQYHFWNTEFLMDLQGQYRWLKYITPLLAVGIIAAVFYILRTNRKSMVLFFSNLLVTGMVSIIIFPLGCARYTGLIYIGFIVAWWLCCYENTPAPKQVKLANVLFIVQILAASVALTKDSKLPFSNFNRVNELIHQVPANEKVVTDYWALNAVAGFADRPLYCIDMQKEMSYLLWDHDMTLLQQRPDRYYEGAKVLAAQGIHECWLVSTGTPEALAKVDSRFVTMLCVTLVYKIEGAIEKEGNLYLYHITPR